LGRNYRTSSGAVFALRTTPADYTIDTMHSNSRCSGVLLGLALFAAPVHAESKAERGKYLVEEVAKCGDCHTPMGPEGADRSRWLKGTVLGIQPIEPIKGWHKTAPDLTTSGRLWQRWGENGLIRFLTTGTGPNGNKAEPPMPTYTLKPEDAEAMVAYLKTLK
jgi:mono/diheme cytochrome c family protein